jgi:DNA-directed RNA polymerase specialized sigma24 family protein
MRIAKQVHSSLIRVARFYSSSRAEEEKLCTCAITQASADTSFPEAKKEQGRYFYNLIRLKKEPVIPEMPQLIQQHYKYLYTQMLMRANKRTGDVDQSEELVQNAFSNALEYYTKHGWQPSSSNAVKSLSAYLCRIVETLFIDQRRAVERHKTDTTDEFKAGWVIDQSFAGFASEGVILQHLKKKLSDNQFIIITMLAEGYKLEEIAERLNVKKANIQQELYKTQAIVRREIKTQAIIR